MHKHQQPDNNVSLLELVFFTMIPHKKQVLQAVPNTLALVSKVVTRIRKIF
ncbi:hypothetical protein WN55_03493 [Dufourea novaeangliae]|uniref:Uncharacterized protein n=1 Tax=Dufourea novaeangliae TaxID=178035 RepID=A0A154PL22_DUFNO|nr:hypothetical protein WN55_03493 [Dufourea novaeangliae]